MNRFLFLLFLSLVVLSCEKPLPEDDTLKDVLTTPVIELTAPADGSSIDLEEVDAVEFEWTTVEGVNSYKILISVSEDMSSAKEISAVNNPMKVKSETIDAVLKGFGLGYEESGTFYWSVAVWGSQEAETRVRSVVFKRKKELIISYEDRIAEPLTIPVAVLYEDPIIPGTNTRLSQKVHPGWGYKWNNPKVQVKEFERDMEASSHGVVQYEIVREVECDMLFSYHKESASLDEKEYMTVDTLANYYFVERKVDGVSYYDYVGMMKHYGFDKMVDAGEIKEIWVYTHPASGMNESRLIGDGAFWCNSGGIGAPEAPCSELCCVMFCNYERTTDLAMHSYAHRVESIMSQVYEQKGGFNGWNYSSKTRLSDLTNWEKFSAHHNEYARYKEGYAHIGMCHWPPNSDFDYDYANSNVVMTYADTWYNYPDIKEDDSVARRVNMEEWKDAGGYQWGYMKWYFEHLPHFKGLCPRDSHLNNWWHYIVDYNGAMTYERRLQNE